jgi:hypothetical protein
MVEGDRPPLHRLTMLRDDPAAKWLGPWSRLQAAAAGMVLPAVWLALLCFTFSAQVFIADASRHNPRPPVETSYLVSLTACIVLSCLLPTVYWASLQLRSRAILALVWKGVVAEALALDDWSKLDDAPDDQPISLVGWVRARQQLRYRVDGKPCVGLALGCRLKSLQSFVGTHYNLWTQRPDQIEYIQRYSEVMETLFDFDLVDDDGRAIPIRVAGGRLLGERNVALLGDDQDERDLIAWLALPRGCRPLPKKAYVLRDGDPVMVVGYKTTVRDPAQAGLRDAPVQAVLASASPLPLLVYPLPAARRREDDAAIGDPPAPPPQV